MRIKTVYENEDEKAFPVTLKVVENLRVDLLDDDGNPVVNEKGKAKKETIQKVAVVGFDIGANLKDATKKFSPKLIYMAWQEFCEKAMRDQVAACLRNDDVDGIKEIESDFVPYVDEKVLKAIAEVNAAKRWMTPEAYKEAIAEAKKAAD